MAEAKQVDFLINGVRDPLTDEPLAGGKVYTYEAGTSTPAALYIDRDTTAGSATNPVILDAYGRAEVFGNGVYKFVVTDADDVTVIEMDNLEYYAVISDTAIPALTANLDFNGNIGKNLAPGTEAGHTVEYAQFVAATEGVPGLIADLDIAELAIDAVEGRMTAAESDIGTLKGQMTAAKSDIGTLQSDVDAVEDAVTALKFTDLTDTPATLAAQGTKVPQVNAGGTALELKTPAELLATASFLNLSDTPSTYVGQGEKLLRVNTGATAVEFVSLNSLLGVGSLIELSDTPAAYTGNAGKSLVVNTGESAVEFAHPDAKTIQATPVSATVPIEGQILTATGGVWTPKTPVAVGINRVELYTTESAGIKEVNVGLDLYLYMLIGVRLEFASKTHHIFFDPSMAGILVTGDWTRVYVVYEPTFPAALYIDFKLYEGSYWMLSPGDFKRVIGYK